MANDPTVERLTKWAKSGKPGSEPIPAATVVLLRDATEGGIETLMLRRNSKIAFGGMWVFPGGRVDDADRSGLDSGDDVAVARRAAVREAIEEAGLVVDESALVPHSHWTPPPVTPKRYLTWFFLAEAPDGVVAIDQGEIKEHEWMRPSAAIERRDAKEIELAPPTWITLNDLTKYENVDVALTAETLFLEVLVHGRPHAQFTLTRVPEESLDRGATR